jgi:hypothetical protein
MKRIMLLAKNLLWEKGTEQKGTEQKLGEIKENDKIYNVAKLSLSIIIYYIFYI